MNSKSWVTVKVAPSRSDEIKSRVQVGKPSPREAIYRLALSWATPCPITIPSGRLGPFFPSWNLLLEDEATLSATLYSAFPSLDLAEYATPKAAHKLLKRPWGVGESSFAGAIRRLASMGFPKNFIVILKNIDRAHPSVQAAIADMLLHNEVRNRGLRPVSVEGMNFICTAGTQVATASIDPKLKKILVPASVKGLMPEQFTQWLGWRLAALTLPAHHREMALVLAKIDPALLAKLTRMVGDKVTDATDLESFVSALEAALAEMGPVPEFPQTALSSSTAQYLTDTAGELSWAPAPVEARVESFRFPLGLTLLLFQGRAYS